jgi:hypothetical protein
LFWAAQVLVLEGITDENDIVPTLAFAARAPEIPHLAELKDEFSKADEGSGVWERFRQYFLNAFGPLQVKTKKDEVLIVRREPFSVGIYPYNPFKGKTEPIKEIIIDIHARPVPPDTLADRYERALRMVNVSHERWDRGSVSYKAYKDSLRLKVQPQDSTIDWQDEMQLQPQQEQLPFPPPTVVRNMYQSLLQCFGYALKGRKAGGPPKQENLVPACVAWYLLGRRGGLIENTALKDTVVRALDKHLLGPLEQDELGDKTSDTASNLWKRVKKANQLIITIDNRLLNPTPTGNVFSEM